MVKDITTCWLTLQLWGTASFPYFYALVCGWLLGAPQTQVLIGRAEQMQHSFHATLMSFALWSQNNRGLMTPVLFFFLFWCPEPTRAVKLGVSCEIWKHLLGEPCFWQEQEVSPEFCLQSLVGFMLVGFCSLKAVSGYTKQRTSVGFLSWVIGFFYCLLVWVRVLFLEGRSFRLTFTDPSLICSWRKTREVFT